MPSVEGAGAGAGAGAAGYSSGSAADGGTMACSLVGGEAVYMAGAGA